MAITAPFRFARIWRRVYLPAWGELVTHDVPFADGLSGEATITLTARTPLVVGGPRRKAVKGKGQQGGREGEVWPFRLPDGTWALPGSTLQGMTRAILEIATFARLGHRIDDRRFAYRSLAVTETAKRHYGKRLSTNAGGNVTPHSRAGWLLGPKENPVIVPCRYARIHAEELIRRRLGLRGQVPAALLDPEDETNVLVRKNNAKERTDWFTDGPLASLDGAFVLEPPPEGGWRHQQGRIRINYHKATFAAAGAAGAVSGTVVITGKPQRGLGDSRKKMDFVFHTPDRSTAPGFGCARPVEPDVWDAFALAHFERRGREENPNWTVWKDEFEAGRPVPVFFWEEGGRISTFGTAFAFKAAHLAGIYDLLRNSAPEHFASPGDALDLPDLVFGAAAQDDGAGGLKRRVVFGLGRSDHRGEAIRLGNAVNLLGPKPGFFEIYVRQRKGGPRPGEPHANYTPVADPARHLSAPELAGVKIWPAAAWPEGAGPDAHAPDQPIDGAWVRTRLNVLPAGTRFTVPMTFQNLRPIELGAVLWALSFGQPEAFGADPAAICRRHRLGMGKPYGLGTVRTGVDLRVDDDDRSAIDFVKAFEQHMAEPCAIGPEWPGSKNIAALHWASDPDRNIRADLHYMRLQGDNPQNRAAPGTYVGERAAGRVMDDYVDGPEPEPPPPPLVVGATVRLKAPHRRSGEQGPISVIFPGGQRVSLKLPDGSTTAAAATEIDVIAQPR
jgi:CRISPR-associated protein (TIGR03986 family)